MSGIGAWEYTLYHDTMTRAEYEERTRLRGQQRRAVPRSSRLEEHPRWSNITYTGVEPLL